MTQILAQTIKRKLPEWNERIINENAMYEACERTGVRVAEWPIKSRGEYLVEQGVPFILLRKGLKDAMRHWVGLHELGHHLLHYPATHHFSKSVRSRMDREANFFAAVAMMPTALCLVATPSEIVAEYGYAPEIVEIRREITEHYRI